MNNLNVSKENMIHNKWMNIKEKSKQPNPNIEELDHLTQDLLAYLGALTEKGYDHIEGVHFDVYKNRVWNVVENFDLLPEYKDEDPEDEEYDDEY
jgi:uncharacterized protein YabN with tetrapyrrole methylase and pyrophosphatase domain